MKNELPSLASNDNFCNDGIDCVRISLLTQPLLTFVLAMTALPVARAAERLPNVIIIYADDVGYGDLGCYGATQVATPNLDDLAARGIRFRAAYATASTCTPSRYSLLTGEYAFRNRNAVILPGNAPLIIDPQKPTIASLLKTRGYVTGLVGKWHLGLGKASRPLDWNGEIAPGPRELGFDYAFHMAATGDRVPSVYIENGRVVGLKPDDPIAVSYRERIGDGPLGTTHPELLKVQADEQHAQTIVNGVSRIGYMTGGREARWTDETMSDTFLRQAVGFIQQHKDEPFFLYYAAHENHVPRVTHPRFRHASGLGVRGDAVAQLDWNVGVLVDTLQDLGLLKNTLIIFSSDNGPVLNDGYADGAEAMSGDHAPAGPWRGGKYSVWEGGTRVPLIVSWRSVVKPGLSDALVSQVDFFASLAALTGAETPVDCATDSVDLLPVLTGRSDAGRDHVIQQGVGTLAIRMGPWKYVPAGAVTTRGSGGQFSKEKIEEPGALYYLPEDPAETRNVAASYRAKAKQLATILNERSGLVDGQLSSGGQLGGATGQ